MRKSHYALLIFAQLLILLIFSNSYALFRQMEKKSLENYQELLELKLDKILSRPGALNELEKESIFVEIVADNELIKSAPSAAKKIILSRKLQDGKELIVAAAVNWPLYYTSRQSKNLYSAMSIFFLITLFITCLTFLIKLKKKPEAEIEPEIAGWQSYLQSLSQSKNLLEEAVQAKEKSLQEKEELTFNLLNNLEFGIIVVSSDSKIALINPTAQKIFATTFALAKNTHLTDFFQKQPQIAAAINELKIKSYLETEINERFCALTLLKLEKGGVLILIEDITEKHLRQKIAADKNRFLEMSEIASTIAHEIKNSLNVILGYARIATEQPEKIEALFLEIENLNQFIENFLQYARCVEKVKIASFNIKQLINGLQEKLSLPIELNAEEETIESDALILKQILSNLLINAQQAGATKIRIFLQKKPGYYLIEVADNGRGIPPEVREKIWLPFFSARKDGSGLGLAIVKRLVNLLNGEIELIKNSAANETIFQIKLMITENGR